MATCEIKRIQQNSAQKTADRAAADLLAAKHDYLACLGPEAQAQAAITDAQAALSKTRNEAAGLHYMHELITTTLEKQAAAGATFQNLETLLQNEKTRLSAQSDELKNTIRKSRRIFLDSSPQTSPAVGGLYFTLVPDNQVLIAFIACFGAFILFAGVGFGLNLGPVAALNLSSGERWSLVTGFWIGVPILTYIALWLFT